MLKVAITAANSFIGRKLCNQLDEKGYQVCAIVRTSFSDYSMFEKTKNVKIVKCDMEEYKNLKNILCEDFDIGITLAWNGTRGEARNNHIMQENNYIFSVDCIKNFIDMGCSAIMTAGSQMEYGVIHGNNKVLETDKCEPNTEYGKAKLKLYHTAKKICYHKARLIEPRFFSLYGSDDFEGTMIISIVKRMLQNKPCNLTECIQLWDFLYIDDAIDVIVRLLECDTADGIYNVGSGISKPLKEYIKTMYRLTNSKSMLNYGAIAYPPTGIVHTNPSVQKIMDELEWKPRISFEEGIEKVIKYQEHMY